MRRPECRVAASISTSPSRYTFITFGGKPRSWKTPSASSFTARSLAAGALWETRLVARVPAIEIRDLRVVRGGQEVLPGIDLTVAGGSVTGLLGPSGSGKTTLMRAIVGVQIVASGAVVVL